MATETADLDALAELIGGARAGVAFTGAGVSTDSGIPDYRSPGGIWTRYDPREFTFQRYVESPDVRQRAWVMRRELAEQAPQPNAAHRALADLEAAGRLVGVVTQNIDGLHQDAGSQRVVEIHGTVRRVTCIGERPRGGTPQGCGFSAPQEWALERVAAGQADPGCPECAGLLKSATISFGQNLEPAVLDQATEMAASADVLLTVGSSLQVYPAAGIPQIAKDAGAALAIVNDQPTPLDDLADVVVRGRAAEVLAAVVDGRG